MADPQPGAARSSCAAPPRGSAPETAPHEGPPVAPPGRGLFLVLEGGDNTGKSTQAGLLAAWLQDQGRRVVRTFEPGDTMLGRTIRQVVLDPASGNIDPRAEALLYAADKAQHIRDVVGPALARGDIVVCDRYVDSMIAYQGAGRVLDPAEIARLAWWAAYDTKPDLTILLDVPVSDALGGKDERDRIERAGQGFHERVRAFFLDLAAAEPCRYLVLQRGTIDETQERIREAVGPLLSEGCDTMVP